MISLDISSPESCSENLRSWLKKARVNVQSFLNKRNVDENNPSLSELNLSYLKNVRFKNEIDRNVDNNITTKPFINFGVPIIVVGCKADLINV